ncbi:MAG: hypothetical protein AB7I30_01255 [Isosphaeraceae bacterium]
MLPMNTPPPFQRPTQGLITIVDQIAGVVELGVAVMLRCHFGRRYLSWLGAGATLFALFGAKVVIGFAIVLGSYRPRLIFSRAEGYAINVYGLDLLSYVVALLCLVHLVEVHRHDRRSPATRHTRYGGRPLPFFFWFVDDEAAIRRFLEPLFVWGVSALASDFDALVAWYLRWGAAALFVRGNIAYYRMKGGAWDLADAMIEQKYRMALLYNHSFDPEAEDRSRRPSPVAPAAPPAPAESPGLGRVYERLTNFEGLLTPLAMRPEADPGPAPAGNGAHRLIIACPSCGQRFSAPARHAGRTVRCKRCERPFAIARNPPDALPTTIGGPS